MNILAIDCSANLCAACVYDAAAGNELGREVRDLGKGHAEHLMAVVERALEASGVAFAGLGAIAVSVGPGSFTGVRVGVSAARGFALALKIPAIGITTLEAIAAEARGRFGGKTVLAALDAGRGEIHAAVYDEFGTVLYTPAVATLSEAVFLARQYRPVLAGSAARIIAEAAAPDEFSVGQAVSTADIGVYARLAAIGGRGPQKPRPVYLRDPDAKPQAGFILPRLAP